MNNKYINIYNNLINLTRNKNLYKNFKKQDTFSDRLVIFLFHFAFLLKIYKKDHSKKELQNIYDYIFKLLELSIRENGFGDMTINKKMKEYVNVFYKILNEINNWETTDKNDKIKIFYNYFSFSDNSENIVNYFENYCKILTNIALNSLTKGVIKL